MTEAWTRLFSRARAAFGQSRTFERAHTLGLAGLLCLGRRTLTQMLCACGQQFADWSAAYRLFERERFDRGRLWDVAIGGVVEALPEKAPVVALLDDTLLRKRGKKIHGASWRRDPLGPPFSTNFVWANRFLQISLALPEHPECPVSPARAIPVDLHHAPTPRKPNRRADGEQWRRWRQARAAAAISRQGVVQLQALRDALDRQPGGDQRRLVVCADATFTNRTVLKHLPPRTTLIGRIRKDARLHALPDSDEQPRGRGRNRAYGRRLPTPEQIRRDEAVPWQTVRAFAAGRIFDFEVKVLTPVRWQPAGPTATLTLLIVRPLAYRLTQDAPLNYRDPVYLISTDPTLSPQEILQAYLWRWEIELNFRDEKTLVGVGKAQVRTPSAVQSIATFLVFAYALLLLAADTNRPLHAPLARPAWQRPSPKRTHQRLTTPQAISLLRASTWADALDSPKKNGFILTSPLERKPWKIENTLKNAVVYAMQ